MNIYNRSSIVEYYKKHALAKTPLEIWFEEVENNSWSSPNKLKSHFGRSVSILKNGRVVFDIKGNDFRLIAAINYENAWVFIKFIGTHAEYDQVDANAVDRYKSKTKSSRK